MDRDDVLALKYGALATAGWGPRLRARFGYITPDDEYEIAVERLVTADTDWLDVGCGRALLPGNPGLAEKLAARCRSVTGVDPDPNVLDNPLLQHSEQCLLQDFRTDMRFDLVTLRMVVEHVTEPGSFAQALAALLKPGGQVLIYTVNKWSPVPLLAACTPMGVHHLLKRVMWDGEERDTFPVAYRMNTRRTLRDVMGRAGLEEGGFRRLPDTRVTQKIYVANLAELTMQRALGAVGLIYPEYCLMGTYRRARGS